MRILIASTVGFIGGALAQRLLARGDVVHGFDNHNDYYAPALKEARLARFANHPNHTHQCADLADAAVVDHAFAAFKPQRVAHQARRIASTRPATTSLCSCCTSSN